MQHIKQMQSTQQAQHTQQALYFQQMQHAQSMQQVTKLKDLQQGHRAMVVDIESGDGMRRRLQDLGLIKGSEVVCLKKSPLGDPVAYYIRGTVIALRSEDSSCIQVIASHPGSAGIREEAAVPVTRGKITSRRGRNQERRV